MPPVLGALTGLHRAWREALAAAGLPHTWAPGRLPPGAQVQQLSLGNTSLAVVSSPGSRPGLCFINLHENEQTAVQAARGVLAERGGTLVELRARGRRLLAFRRGWRWCALDPNRIFSANGLEATLRQHGCTAAAMGATVQPLRDALLAALPTDPETPIVALHNNQGGSYSVLQYVQGGAHAADAAAVALPNPDTPQDFFVVTRTAHFDWLVQRGYNTVLQASAGAGAAADDGSLSLWALRQGRAYVNVEALNGRLAEQRTMLLAVCDMADQGARPASTPQVHHHRD